MSDWCHLHRTYRARCRGRWVHRFGRWLASHDPDAFVFAAFLFALGIVYLATTGGVR